MSVKKEEKENMILTVTEGLTVTIHPSLNHEFLMSTKEVANGYGTSDYVIRRSKLDHSQELVEGKHFIKGVSFSHTHANAQPHQIFWTKRGVVRLGFFIKSERARMFRDWAEELIIKIYEQKNLFGEVLNTQRQLPPKRKHNRLTHERLLNIMADICKIEDKDLRLSISTKLMNGGIA